jgi:hypothetical protein
MPRSAVTNDGIVRMTHMKSIIALFLILLALAGCANGYSGPPDDSFVERSHGKP